MAVYDPRLEVRGPPPNGMVPLPLGGGEGGHGEPPGSGAGAPEPGAAREMLSILIEILLFLFEIL